MGTHVYFGSDVLDQARRESGLLNTEICERLGIDDTTWVRWRQAGHVPSERAADVAALLKIELIEQE